MDFSPWPEFEDDEINAALGVLKSGKVNQWTGDEILNFESEFSGYVGSEYAIALANGSLALDLAMIVYDIGPGDEVIVTPRSFVASASCIALRGAVPVFVDVDTESQNITLAGIQEGWSEKTKAVIAVHLAGWPCDLEEIRDFCDKKQIILIEDCAQAHGAEYKGRKVGSYGHCSVFSFCQDKIMTTGGEGGILLTNDRDVWEKAWSYKDHGKSHAAVFSKAHPVGFRWYIESLGTNYRMTEFQAAIGRVMLRKLDRWVTQRGLHANTLNEAFSEIPGLRVTIPPSTVKHAYYKYYVFIDPDVLKPAGTVELIINRLNALGVPCAAGICPEIYLEKAFASYPHRIISPDSDNGCPSCSARLPNAKFLGRTSLMFMVHPTLTGDMLARVIEEVQTVMKEVLA